VILTYHALPPQYRFLRSRAKFAGLFGGIGSGKSHVGCFWALAKALRNPGCLGLIGANSYRQLKDATLRTFEMLLQHYRIGHSFHTSDMAYRLDTGAEILCRSMENYDLLRGVELGWFYLDELRDTRFEAWCVVKGRLRSQNVDALEGRVTSSPNGYNWIYEEFVRKPADPATAAAYANHDAFVARTADNKHLPPDYVAALLASYDPLLVAQELDGRFTNTTQGRIYHAFEREAHVTSEAELVPGQPLLWSLDFNVTPMTAVIAQLEDCRCQISDCRSSEKAGRALSSQSAICNLQSAIRVVDEIWLVNSNTLAMCEAFANWLADHGLFGPLPPGEGRVRVLPPALGAGGGPGSTLTPRPQAGTRSPRERESWACPVHGGEGVGPAPAILVYGDAAGSARSTSGRSDYAIIREFFPEAQVCAGSSNPCRRDRHNAVNAALRNAHGEARLRIHPRCRRLIEDLERACYQPPTNEPDTSDPLRGHISDALGYLVARVMPAGRAGLTVGRW